MNLTTMFIIFYLISTLFSLLTGWIFMTYLTIKDPSTFDKESLLKRLLLWTLIGLLPGINIVVTFEVMVLYIYLTFFLRKC